jgi:hypothetical protein
MVWQLTQSGASFSGMVMMTDSSSGATGSGSVSGTLSGSAIHFTISIPAGGFVPPYASCSATATGDGQASTSAISATYTGSNSCSGAVTAGQLTLNKQ